MLIMDTVEVVVGCAQNSGVGCAQNSGTRQGKQWLSGRR